MTSLSLDLLGRIAFALFHEKLNCLEPDYSMCMQNRAIQVYFLPDMPNLRHYNYVVQYIIIQKVIYIFDNGIATFNNFPPVF